MSRSVFVKLKLTAPGGWHLLLSAAHTEESHLNRNGKVSLDETLLTRLFKKLVFGIVLRAHLVSLYLIFWSLPSSHAELQMLLIWRRDQRTAMPYDALKQHATAGKSSRVSWDLFDYQMYFSMALGTVTILCSCKFHNRWIRINFFFESN